MSRSALQTLFYAVLLYRGNARAYFRLAAACPHLTWQHCSTTSHLLFDRETFPRRTMGVHMFKDLSIFNTLLKTSVDFNVGWITSLSRNKFIISRCSVTKPNSQPWIRKRYFSPLLIHHTSFQVTAWWPENVYYCCCFCWIEHRVLILFPLVSKSEEQRATGVMFKYNSHVRPDTQLWTIWSVLQGVLVI